MTTKISEHLLTTQVINKNYIINPAFGINQREFAGGALASGYGFDRWLSSSATLNLTLPDANGYITITGATSTTGLQTRVESFGPDTPEVTLSWEGTAQVQYFRANSNSWTTLADSPVTLTLASSDAGGTKEYIQFGNGTLRNVKLETGSIVTPFEYPEIVTELIKCQRYFWNQDSNTSSTAYSRFGVGSYQSAATFDAIIPFPVTMRVAPTITVSAVSHFGVHYANAIYTGTALLVNEANVNSADMRFTGMTGGGIAAAGVLLANNNNNAHIYYNAEL